MRHLFGRVQFGAGKGDSMNPPFCRTENTSVQNAGEGPDFKPFSQTGRMSMVGENARPGVLGQAAASIGSPFGDGFLGIERFSTSSQTGFAFHDLVIRSLLATRWAGRQCRNLTPGAAGLMPVRCPHAGKPLKASSFLLLFLPMEAHTSPRRKKNS